MFDCLMFVTGTPYTNEGYKGVKSRLYVEQSENRRDKIRIANITLRARLLRTFFLTLINPSPILDVFTSCILILHA
jgi:hypothetical protein